MGKGAHRQSSLRGEIHLYPADGYHRGYGYVDTRYGFYTDQELADYPFGYMDYADADKSMACGKFFVEDGGWELKWEYNGTEIGESGAVFHDGSNAEVEVL